MPLAPPQPPLLWNHTAEEIASLTNNSIDEYVKVLDTIGGLDAKNCTFESVFLKLAGADAKLDCVVDPLTLYRNVSTQKELRDASGAAENLVGKFKVDRDMRVDVFNAKLAAEKNLKSLGQWERLSPEEQRLVERYIRDGKRSGLSLPEANRTELVALQKELEQTCIEFRKNYNEEDAVISFTAEELEGIPEDVISGYTKRETENGKEVYDVTYKTPDILPLFKFANKVETRRRADEGHELRLKISVPLLDKALALRRKIAYLLGYETWADYMTEIKMIKTGKAAQQFLDELEQRLRPLGLEEKHNLLAMKQKEHQERGIPFDGEFYNWDYLYYIEKNTKENFSVDHTLIKKYFPVSFVVPAVLNIYQNLLGVKFEAVKDASTWHPDVQVYSVWEKDSEDASGFLGYCYLDLFPRSNKYSHAAVWPLLPGYDKNDHSRGYPVAAMVANLAKPTPNVPALMNHDQLTIFFHEMGHVFHGLLSKTKFSRFHGTSVARDFVEAPSQMLENWCWERKVLELMSNHYETKQPLPADLIDKLIKSRYTNVGLKYLRQIFYAKFDLRVHTDKEPQDYTKLWNTLRETITLVPTGNQGTGQTTFTHLTNYSAGYYGYMYSLVFAADMYETVFKKDPLNPSLGKLYRDKILRVGASRDEMDSLKDFLGREPNDVAFLDETFGHLKTSPQSYVKV